MMFKTTGAIILTSGLLLGPPAPTVTSGAIESAAVVSVDGAQGDVERATLFDIVECNAGSTVLVCMEAENWLCIRGETEFSIDECNVQHEDPEDPFSPLECTLPD